MVRQVVVAALLALILPIDVVSGQDVVLSLDGGNLNYNSSSDIYGFQFDHDGCASGAEGVDAASAGFTISASAASSTVLGFSFTGAFVVAGSGTLLDGVNCDEISNITFTGTAGSTLSAGVAEEAAGWQPGYCGGSMVGVCADGVTTATGGSWCADIGTQQDCYTNCGLSGLYACCSWKFPEDQCRGYSTYNPITNHDIGYVYLNPAVLGGCDGCDGCKTGGTCNWMWDAGNCPEGWQDCYPVATCDDAAACNNGAEGDCTYAAQNFDCDGNCTATVDCNGDCAGTAEDLGCGCGAAAAAEGSDCDGNPLGCTDVAYNMGGGNWDVEMSFTINGETYTAGEGTVCLVDGCYPVTLSDSYGDGWNGGLLTLGDHLFGMPSGFTADGQISMNAADCPVSGVLIYGCTDAAATNYNADANDDDDSCAYDCDTYVVDETTYTCYWYVWVYGPSYGYTLETVNGWGNKNCACVEEFVPIYGCTDAGATNYNAEANSDDDSCAYDCDTYVVDESTGSCYWYVWVFNSTYVYTVETVNGWGTKNCACVEEFVPIYGCMHAGATNYNAEANSDDDSCAWDCDTLAEYTAGGWEEECSFTITDCDGNVLASMASGSDGFAQCVEWGDNYSISLADSYGDGWNNGTLNVGGTVYDVGAGGSSADFTVGDCAGAAANGDPHLKNIKGESFDVMQTGNMLLLEVPRGSRVETLEFAVHGDIERLGLVECGPTFITKVVMAGRWLEFPVSIRAGKSTHKPFGIQLNEGGWKAHADFEKTTNGRMSVIKRDRAFLMKVDVLDIAVSMPNRPRAFLDLQIKGIGKITAQVGGLLGLDDHTAAESLPSECNSPKRRRLSVLRAEVGEEWSASAAL